MTRQNFLSTLVALLALGFADASFAQTSAAPQNPVQKLHVRTDEMLKGLDENHLRQFEAIRSSHGTIRAVADVRTLLTTATKACIAENPDMKEQIMTRFTAWKDTVDPVLRQGQNRLDKMVLLQNFERPSRVRQYLRLFDEAVDWRTAQNQSMPISEKAACEKMLESMNDTQKELSDLLIKTLKLDQNLIIQPKKETP